MHHKRDQWFLAIDQGGHASRALVYNSNGALVESTYCEIETLEKPGNIVEHDANAFLASVTKVLDELAQKLGKNLTHISSAGLACQRSSIVCWNRENGKALSPVISWQDRRTADDLHRYSAHRELIQNKTGLLLNPHYGASKMRWCLENLPAIADAEHQGALVMSPVASYLLFHLLEQHPIVVDPANAGRTLIYDYKTGNWCDELLTVFGIKENTLPTCVNSIHSYGTIALHGHEIDFKLCTGDQSAAVFYSGMPQPDSLYINAGTGAFVQQIQNSLFDDDKSGLLKSIVFLDENQRLYVREGTVNGAGRALQWYAEKTGCPDYTKHLENWLNDFDSPPLFLNAIAGVGSPFWATFDSHFSRECSTEEGFVAIVESILFLLQSNINLFSHFQRIYISGGLSNSALFCQHLADLSSVVVCRQKVHEATAKGIFMLLSKTESSPEIEKEFIPHENGPLNQRFAYWQKEMRRILS